MLNLLTTYAIDLAEPIAKWATIGLAVALIIACLIVFLAKKSLFAKFTKSCLIAFVFYALIAGITLLVLELTKKFDLAYLEAKWVNLNVIKLVFIPVITTLSIALVSLVLLLVFSKVKPNALKKLAIICGIVCGIAIIVTLVSMAIYHQNYIVGDGYYTDESSKFSSSSLYVSAVLVVLIISVTSLIVGKNNKTTFDTRCISFAGICLALSFTLSFIKFEAAWLQGGSITLVSFLPICLFSYCYGMKKGLIVGLIYGLLQAVQDPWLIHPAQFLLDYPIAFSAIAFSGLLTDLNVMNNNPTLKFCLGVVFTGLFRYIAHTLSGVFAFGAYAVAEGATSFLVYSLIYNSYVFIDIALVIVAGILILANKSFRKELCKMNPMLNEK